MTIFYNFSCNWNHFFGFLCIATEIIGKVFWNEIKFLCILSLQSSSTGPWYQFIEGQYILQIYICLFWYLITIFRFISLFYNEKGQFLEFLQSVFFTGLIYKTSCMHLCFSCIAKLCHSIFQRQIALYSPCRRSVVVVVTFC